MLFGIIEAGTLVGDVVALRQAAREGVRSAAVGATPAAIDQRVAAAATMDPGGVTVLCEYRTNDQDGAPGQWTALGAQDGENNAGAGDQVRVTLTFSHRLIAGRFFSFMADQPGGTTRSVSASVTMRRE